jgi:hypothetical protein
MNFNFFIINKKFFKLIFKIVVLRYVCYYSG